MWDMKKKAINKGSENRKVHDDAENEPIQQINKKEKNAEQVAKNNQERAQENTPEAKAKRKLGKTKALLEFRSMVEDSVNGNYLIGKPPKNLSSTETKEAKEKLSEMTLWGVPLLPSKGHPGTDVVLLKFLKARDFKVREAFKMLRKTLKWRMEFKTDTILEEDLELPQLNKFITINSMDKQGRPLCFNNYGVLKDKDSYEKMFGTQENCDKFLRWRIQYMEKGIRELTFKDGGANSVVQITDLKQSPGPAMKELRVAGKKALSILQDHYPELVYRFIIINVPFWYYASHALSSKILSQRTQSKFVFSRSSNVTKTLLKFISPENLSAEYGGLKRENDQDFFPEDKVYELIVRKNTLGCLQIPVSEAGTTVVWDLSVVGWDVSYKDEFIPDDEGSYRVLLHNYKEKKGLESVRSSYYINEPGKIVISIDNRSLKKKRVFYRYKTKPTAPMYIFLNK